MLITNFSSGELSETLSGRVDLPIYFQGCKKLINFDVIPTGGIKRRVGTERVGKLAEECRLIPFILDKDNSFILEFIPKKIYVWKNGEKLIDILGEQVCIETEYESLAQIKEIQYAQNYDTMIFVQKDFKPLQIVYNFSTKQFDYGPMGFDYFPDVQLDDDFDFVKIADENGLPEAEFDGQYCVYKGQLWKWDEKNTEWVIDGDNPDVDTELFNTENKYPGCVSFFNGRLYFASTHEKRQKVWASCTPDTQGTRYNDFSTYQKFVTVEKVVKDPDVHIFTANILVKDIDKNENITVLTSVTQDLTEANVLEKDITEYFITASESSYIPVGTKVLSCTKDSITINKALDLEEDASSIVFTIQLWRSSNSPSADDYEYKVINNNLTTSDCAFFFEVASDQNDAIQWIASNKFLAIGTESSIWCVPSSVTAQTVIAEMNGRYGSDAIQGQCVGDAMIFFAQGKRGIREYYYSSQDEAFRTNDIAITSEQMLTESPAIDFDFVTNPYNRILIVRADGSLVSLLYDKNNGVMAWNRIELATNIISCAVVRGDAQSDIVYFAVKDGENYYLERLDENKKIYLDSYSLYNPGIAGTDGYSDKAFIFNKTKNLIISVNDEMPEDFISENDGVYIGYKFESLISSMPCVANDPVGKKRIIDLSVRFMKSYMPIVSCTDKPDEFFNAETIPFTGLKKISYPGTADKDVNFTIKIDEPYECNILAVNATVS